MNKKILLIMLLTISIFSIGNAVKADTIYSKIREYSVRTDVSNPFYTRTFKTKDDGYVVGTKNEIVYIDKNGKEVWRQKLPISSVRSISLFDMVVNKDSVVYTTCSPSINLDDGIPGTLSANSVGDVKQSGGKLSNSCITQKLKLSNGSFDSAFSNTGGYGIETIGDNYYIFYDYNLLKINSNLQISKSVNVISSEEDNYIVDITTYGDNLYVLTEKDIKVYDSDLNLMRKISLSFPVDDSYGSSELIDGPMFKGFVRGFIYDGSKFFYTNGSVMRSDVSGRVEPLLPYRYSSNSSMFVSGIRVDKYFVVGNNPFTKVSNLSKVEIYDSNINLAQSINLGSTNHETYILNISPSNYGFVVKWVDLDTQTLYVTEYGKKFNIKTNIKGQGKIDVDSIAFAGDKISFRVMAKDGYVVSKIAITTSSGKKVVFNEENIEQDSNGLITLNNGNFIMPGDDITIDVQFRKAFFSNPETGRNTIIITFLLLVSAVGVILFKKNKVKETN